MYGTSTSGDRFTLVVPQVWGTSGSITINSPAFSYTIAYTVQTAVGPLRGYLIFAENNDLGLFYGLPMSGLGLMITAKHIGARASNTEVLGSPKTEGLIICLFSSVVTAKGLAGKIYTSFNYLQPDQKGYEKGLAVGFTSFKATSGIEISNSSIILGSPETSLQFYNKSNSIVIGESQNNATTTALTYMPNVKAGNGFALSQNANGLNIGWGLGDLGYGSITKPGNFFAVPQEKLSGFNPFYVGIYKIVCMVTRNAISDWSNISASEPKDTDVYSAGTGSLEVKSLAANKANCEIVQTEAVNKNTTQNISNISFVNGTYTPFSASTFAAHPFFTNKLPGTFTYKDSTSITQSFGGPFAPTTVTKTSRTIAFFGSSSKQKRIVFSVAQEATTRIGSSEPLSVNNVFIYGLGTAT